MDAIHLDCYFVDITPHPVLARLQRADNRMFGRMKMLRSVFVFRGIATSHMPTRETQAKMNPAIAHLEALFASVGMRLHLVEILHVRALHETRIAQD
jgi:hypothetical protein